MDLVYKLRGKFVANVDDIRPQFRTNENAFLSQNAIYAGSLVRDSGQAASATIDQFSGVPVSAVSGFKEEASPWYSDQVLPFDYKNTPKILVFHYVFLGAKRCQV